MVGLYPPPSPATPNKYKKKNGKKDVFQIPKLMVLLFNSQKEDIKRK